MYEAIPQWLKEHGLFCGFTLKKTKNGRFTKIPCDLLTGKWMNKTNKDNYHNFETALANAHKFSGIGIGLFNGIRGVDCDHCIDKQGQISPLVTEIISTMNSYTEKSPSGTGIHILFFDNASSYCEANYATVNSGLGLEIYSGNQYLTLTGDMIHEGGIEERSKEIKIILDKYMKRPEPLKFTDVDWSRKSFLSDNEVLYHIRASNQKEKFDRLWSGDESLWLGPAALYPSQSEADLALCSILAFWCSGDIEQINRLCEKSGLIRLDGNKAWDSQHGKHTYGDLAILKALSNTNKFYSPLGRSLPEEDFTDTPNRLEKMHPVNNNQYEWTDIGSSRLFADFFVDRARFVPERRSWFCYEDGYWQQDRGNLKAMELCKTLANSLLRYTLTLENEKTRTNYIKYVNSWQKRSTRETILKDAQSVHPISIAEFDADPYLLNCKNGTLHLKTLEFKDHEAKDKLTKMADVFYDSVAVCPRFTSFIDEVTSGDKEKAKFLQKAFGYGITGDTRLECLFILYGSTSRNGKGTLCESILKVMGSYGCAARPETISLKTGSNSSSPTEDIARLAGIRLANIAEPSKGLVLNTAQVKTMTGNDTLNARFLHENSFDFKPQFKLYINTNHLPVINDMTLFTSGRVMLIPFDRHFDESDQDKSLKHEFIRPNNQSAILNWLIEGYRSLQIEGLKPPASILEAIYAYRHDSNKILLFMEDCLEEDKDSEEKTSDVYARYNHWCQDNGHYAENMRNFKLSLSVEAQITRKRPKGGGEKTTMLTGYKLISEFL